AVVSRGGRPDLAGEALQAVSAPTLLIVGGADRPVIPLTRSAFEQLSCEKDLAIVPGATHLFEEPGTLEQVTQLAKRWFSRYLSSSLREAPDGLVFTDRREAGRRLVPLLTKFRDQNPVVLALPRGGAPVVFEVAQALK